MYIRPESVPDGFFPTPVPLCFYADAGSDYQRNADIGNMPPIQTQSEVHDAELGPGGSLVLSHNAIGVVLFGRRLNHTSLPRALNEHGWSIRHC